MLTQQGTACEPREIDQVRQKMPTKRTSRIHVKQLFKLLISIRSLWGRGLCILTKTSLPQTPKFANLPCVQEAFKIVEFSGMKGYHRWINHEINGWNCYFIKLIPWNYYFTFTFIHVKRHKYLTRLIQLLFKGSQNDLCIILISIIGVLAAGNCIFCNRTFRISSSFSVSLVCTGQFEEIWTRELKSDESVGASDCCEKSVVVAGW